MLHRFLTSVSPAPLPDAPRAEGGTPCFNSEIRTNEQHLTKNYPYQNFSNVRRKANSSNYPTNFFIEVKSGAGTVQRVASEVSVGFAQNLIIEAIGQISHYLE